MSCGADVGVVRVNVYVSNFGWVVCFCLNRGKLGCCLMTMLQLKKGIMSLLD